MPPIFKYIIKFVTPLLLGWVFIASLPGIWDTITHKAIYAQIAETTDSAKMETLKETIFFKNISRLLLVAVWVGIAAMVAIAYRKRMREGRFLQKSEA